MKGFRKFILRGNLVDLAVAVVIGTQFSGLVHSFVASFVDPLLALLGGKPNLNRFTFTVGKSTFTYGTFLTDALSFLIAAAVVYFVIVLPVARLLHLFERDRAATERNCPECDRSIPIQARRCPECTSVLVRDDPEPVDAASGGGPTPVMGPEG
ncbi:large conductance mechanosensitive channel protein MscL [Actinocrinis sp.]|uniref:large conductance mechanosensitive channel protein MscL n=1 Tax=Actinocrinis sp. TaxID=1920516 RepID=UPI002C2A9FD3|nr:large conductance mechanosensitive channel protein MscL [Actinocrinis sp.]HXR73631.1 large conductance mechanosensitive channel protein MscL [Actinocrinis sp.]